MSAEAAAGGFDIVLDAADELAQLPTAAWALTRLEDVLGSAGLRAGRAVGDPGRALRIEVGLAGGTLARRLGDAGIAVPDDPESFLLRPEPKSPAIGVVGRDASGVAYGLLELADIVSLSDDPLTSLRAVAPTSQQPATAVRSILRAFVSDVEDKPWFYDRDFWLEYLTELATQRINRLQLALGMQYNYSHDPDAVDNYLCFPYPFLLDVPNYDVHAVNVSDLERDRNLTTLQFISKEAKRRGIHFQLGLWNHAYEMLDSPDVRYPITGLSSETHANYCAAALSLLLQLCPDIDGLTLRVHYEGGVPEPGHGFWATVMGAVTSVDRPIELDMHAKGVDQDLIDVAQKTGSPVVISAKYWAEHQGLPYHQASVRDREKATKESGSGLRSITAHRRRFTRYGFGDFLREDRAFDVIFRIWPGSQRLLLWGDPVLAAGYGRFGTIGGSLGVELCEPLTFKGRKASGSPGERDTYSDPSLQLGRDDWKKYLYTYRLWGRLLYDPDADPDTWRRYLVHEFGAAAEHVERALGLASRVLPLVTVMHGIGASNNGYWPEMYVNMPIAGGARSDHYDFDTASPGTFGAVSSFDPAFFDRVDDRADSLLAGRRTGRYGPVQTAEWLERLADEAERELAQASTASPDPKSPGFRRMAIDVRAQVGLGRFFAGRNRAGLYRALYARTGEPSYLADAVTAYQHARDAFADVASVTSGVYRNDVTFGTRISEHGHWVDRLPAIDEDLLALRSEQARAQTSSDHAWGKIPSVSCGERHPLEHIVPGAFRKGRDIPVEVTPGGGGDQRLTLHYRHLNQGEEYNSVDMAHKAGRYTATIPGPYTDSPYPLAYFFTVREESGDAWLYPGLDETLANQPYHVLRQQR